MVRSITRALGATDTGTGCSEGDLPNPMELVQKHIMEKTIEIVKTFGIFTACNMLEMEKTTLKSHCIKEYFKSSCGDGIVDEGEDCDCGPPYVCEFFDSCCTPPVLTHQGSFEDRKAAYKKGCKLRPKAECSLGDFCCSNCKIWREKHKNLCTSGTGMCDIAHCDGQTAKCPKGPVASEGLACSMYDNTTGEPLFCTGGECKLKLCESSKLESCTCASLSGFECHVCCIKDGKCQTSSQLGLLEGKAFFKPERSPCVGGICLNGRCVISSKKQTLSNKTMDGAIVSRKNNTLNENDASDKKEFDEEVIMTPPPAGYGGALKSTSAIIFIFLALLLII